MAAVSLLGTPTFTTVNGTKTVTATPAVGDLIVIVTGHSSNTASVAPTDNNSGGAGTYTQMESALRGTSADVLQFWVRDALIASASSTVFTHAPGTTNGGGLAVLKLTGMARVGSAAKRQSAKQENQASGGTPTPVFSVAALTTNPVIAAVYNGTNPATMTARSSPAYSELYDNGYAVPDRGIEIMSIDSGETGTSIAWGGTSGTAFGDIAVELDASALISCTGIASDEAIGSAVVAAAVAAAGIASAEAIGQPTVSVSAVIDCIGIPSAEALGTPTVAATIAGAGIASEEALGAPVVAASVVTVAITSEEALGAPTVGTAIAAAGIASTEAVGAPVLAAVVAASGIASEEAIGLPTISVAGASGTIFCLGIASAEAFGQPVISAEGAIFCLGIASEEAIGQPAVSADIVLAGLASEEVFGDMVLGGKGEAPRAPRRSRVSGGSFSIGGGYRIR